MISFRYIQVISVQQKVSIVTIVFCVVFIILNLKEDEKLIARLLDWIVRDKIFGKYGKSDLDSRKKSDV